MEKLKLWINDLFYACVDILIMISDVFGITYQEANVIIFCFIMPLIIIGLTLIVLGFILAKIEQITKAAEYSSY